MPRKNLSTATRNAIVQFLLQNSKNGVANKGKVSEAASKYGCSRRTVTRLWAAAKKQQSEGQFIHLVSGKKNPKRVKTVHINIELIQQLELHKRSTIRRLAQGINCSKSTVGKWIAQGLLRPHTSAIKPSLTAENKFVRLKFSLEALEFDQVMNILKFKRMNNTIHIDEKWFYITKSSHRFYLTPDEAEPYRSCKSKKFISKVMFMCAVCRPVFYANATVQFDGKIGIFPFTKQVPAMRNSKNRTRGTLETKPIESITKEVIKDCLINKIVPAIKAKWPAAASKTIYIQQDNARPHINDTDPDFRVAASTDVFDIRLVHQPPNSPDTNVNDLGWFRAIQSIQNECVCSNVQELVDAVVKSFDELSPMTLNKVFVSLQSRLVEIMKFRGHNSYKIPHMNKNALIARDTLPIDLEVSASLVRECLSYMVENRLIEVQQLRQKLGL